MPEQRPDILIRNVRVVHGDGRVTPRANVALLDGLIAWIDSLDVRTALAPPRPPARREIDGAGRTLLPGLIDTHVHVQDWTLPVFLKHGVTTVRDLHNEPAYVMPLTREDSWTRPRVIAAGEVIDGTGSFWKNAVQVATVGEARAAVRRQIEGGARVIKVYTRLGPALLSVVAAEAQARGIPVAAHLGMTTALQAADEGVSSIEHLSGIPESTSEDSERLLAAHRDLLGGWTAFELEWLRLPQARLDAIAKQLAARKVVLVPTLALHEAFARLADADLMKDPALAEVPQSVLRGAWDPIDIMGRAHWTPQVLAKFKQVMPILQHFVGAFAKLGGRIAAGTDAPQQFVVPGVSLHRELELLVDSGLSPAEAITSATSGAAALLGLQDRVGTIDAGKTADLILVDKDPLSNIRATTQIWMVVKDGVVVRQMP
jgi:imidazolonepropionase-like amidohydrolase